MVKSIDFSKMIFQFKSWPETIMSGTTLWGSSDFRLPTRLLKIIALLIK